MRSRGTKRRPGAAEWASCLRVDSALTAWLQTVYSGCRVAQAPFGAAERGFCQAAQGCATWIINCKCFRKAHTCKGHRSQHFFPLALFTEPIEATERGIPNVVLFGSFRDLIPHVLPCLPSDSGASQRYSEVAKLELQLQDQLPNAKASMFNWRLKYIELLSQGSINPKFNPIWSYLMYYHVLYDIYIIYIIHYSICFSMYTFSTGLPTNCLIWQVGQSSMLGLEMFRVINLKTGWVGFWHIQEVNHRQTKGVRGVLCISDWESYQVRLRRCCSRCVLWPRLLLLASNY